MNKVLGPEIEWLMCGRLLRTSSLVKLPIRACTGQRFTGALPDDAAGTEKKILVKKWLDLLFQDPSDIVF